jgi:hypothetical protein
MTGPDPGQLGAPIGESLTITAARSGKRRAPTVMGCVGQVMVTEPDVPADSISEITINSPPTFPRQG